MSEYRFYTDVPVRYGDLDPQGHLNNARYLTFMEQCRMSYLIHLGLWEGKDFFNLGLIVAEARITFLAPVLLEQTIRVWTRATRMGNKSLVFEYDLTDRDTGEVCARGETVMVAYDYYEQKSIPVPESWRERISVFDQIPLRA